MSVANALFYRIRLIQVKLCRRFVWKERGRRDQLLSLPPPTAADGGIVTINGNNLQANYESGDGNDLTLPVVP